MQVVAKVLKKNPKYITFLAPAVTYVMTLFAGTGHTAFLALPVIAEVAKKEGIRPSRPLAIGVVASQIAITASPISAAVVFFASALEPIGVDYVKLLLIAIPSTFIACMLGAIVTNFIGKELKDDPVYQERLAKGLVRQPSQSEEYKNPSPGAKLSVLIFGITIICVVFYATAISPTVGLIKKPILARDHAIITFMLAAASLIALLCKVKTKNIVNAATFKSGMSACICSFGCLPGWGPHSSRHTSRKSIFSRETCWPPGHGCLLLSPLRRRCSFIPRRLPPRPSCPLLWRSEWAQWLIAAFPCVSALLLPVTIPGCWRAVQEFLTILV